MRIHGVTIEDTFAEAFRVWACRLIVTAIDPYWAMVAAREATGYGTSVIGCDAEAGVEAELGPDQTPDGRPGVALLFIAFNAPSLAQAMPKRVGQCLMTAPTTAVYDGLSERGRGPADEGATRIELGHRLRYFGDGWQRSKVVDFPEGPRRFWRVPVMDGEFTVEDTAAAVKAIGGGNFMVGAIGQREALEAARRAVEAIAAVPGVITPFPGGVVRSGSKVGSRYKALFASTNDAFCPTLRRVSASPLPTDTGAVYEVVINGLSEESIRSATRVGVLAAAASPGVTRISAGNYGGKLGKFHFHLHPILAGP
jgi:formylmethanofuran--tetrahydromethanopterin N-formyltransferase